MDMKNLALMKEAAKSFAKRHDFKEDMVVRRKKALCRKDENDVAVFLYWLPNSFTGNHDHPFDEMNFLVADCAIMLMRGGVPEPALYDSRYLEPVPEEELTDA